MTSPGASSRTRTKFGQLIQRHLHDQQTDQTGAMRHVSPKTTILIIAGICVVIGLIVPLLFTSGLVPGSAKALAKDPAVALLLTYEKGLDNNPATQTAAADAASELTFTNLSDGSQRISKMSPTGICYYLLVAPGSDVSGVKTGKPSDCA